MAVIVNGDGILTGISSLATALTDITSGRGTVTGVATVGTLQLGAGVSISSPRTQQAAIFTNNTEFLTVDDAGRVGVGTITPNSDAHPENEKKINVGFITAKSIAGDIDARNVVVAGVSTFIGASSFSADVSIADKIVHTGDTDTAIRFAGDDIFTIETGGSERVRVDSVGLKILDKLAHFGDIDTSVRFPSADTVTVETGGSERLRIDSSGNTNFGAEKSVALPSGTGIQVYHSANPRIKLTNDNTGNGATDGTQIYLSSDGDTIIDNKDSEDIIFHCNASEKLRIDSRGDLYVNESSSLSSPYSTFNTVSIGNNLILSGYTGGNGGFAGMQQNAYVNSSGSWTKVYDDYAFSIGGDDGGIFFRNAGTGTGTITWSIPLQITNGGVVKIGGNTANSADLDASNTKLSIKQSANSMEDGIYIERSGERRGYYIYVGGALSTSDSLSISTNQLGGDTELMAIDRGGDIVVANNIKINTAGKGIDFSATSSNGSSELFDDYEEGTFTPTQPTIGTNSASGHYTKIGRYVYASIFMTLPTNSSGVAFYIDDLPFTALNNSGTNIHGGYAIYSTYGSPFTVRVHDNATRAQVSAIGGGNINLSGLDNLNFRIQVHYMTN